MKAPSLEVINHYVKHLISGGQRIIEMTPNLVGNLEIGVIEYVRDRHSFDSEVRGEHEEEMTNNFIFFVLCACLYFMCTNPFYIKIRMTCLYRDLNYLSYDNLVYQFYHELPISPQSTSEVAIRAEPICIF